MNRVLLALLAFFVVASALGQSPAKIRITTWNLEWFPNGSPHKAPPEKQAQRIEAAADVLRKLDPDILLLQEMRNYLPDRRSQQHYVKCLDTTPFPNDGVFFTVELR